MQVRFFISDFITAYIDYELERNTMNLSVHAHEASQHEQDPLEYAGGVFDADDANATVDVMIKTKDVKGDGQSKVSL